MSGPTPGPWVVVPATGCEGETLYWNVEQKLAADQPYRGSVAGVFAAEHIGGITMAEAEANARRICATHDLVEALRHAQKVLAAVGHQDKSDYPTFQIVCRALEKAGAA